MEQIKKKRKKKKWIDDSVRPLLPEGNDLRRDHLLKEREQLDVYIICTALMYTGRKKERDPVLERIEMQLQPAADPAVLGL